MKNNNDMKNNTERYLAPQCEEIEIRIESRLLVDSVSSVSSIQSYETEEL